MLFPYSVVLETGVSTVGESVQFGNTPPDMDIPGLYDWNYAAAMIKDGDEGWSRTCRLTDIQSSDLNGLTSSTSDFEEQEHPGVIDEEENSLPSLPFHDASGNQIDWDEYNRLADLESDHAASGTLHLLYPDLFEEPAGKRDQIVGLSISADKGYHVE